MKHRWTNWVGNHSAEVDAYEEPADIDGVVRAVELARRNRQRLRVVSGAYCWSPLVPVDGMLLSIRKLRAVRHVDRERRQITIETGAPLRDLVLAAEEHGLSVISPAMFLGLTVGGLIATGSHGTGRNAATLGDSVVSLELVTPSGEVRTIERSDSDLWRALITSLGALGVITAVTLQCEPLYNVAETHRTVHFIEAAELIAPMLRDHEFVSVFWSPAGSVANFKLGNRTSASAVRVPGRINPTLKDRTNRYLGRYLPLMTSVLPSVTEHMARIVTKNIGTGSQVVTEPAFSHYQQVYPPVVSSEFAIPVEAASEAWAWVVNRLMAYWRSGIRPVNMVVHARFGRASDALIASSAGRATCHLEVLNVYGNRHLELFATDFDEKMRNTFAGRPHWGKIIARPELAAATHGDAMDAFLEVRHSLDPDQRFLNGWLRDDVFGVGRRRRARPAA